MLQHNSEKIKSHCLKVYTFVAQTGEDAQKEIDTINGETKYSSTLDRCFTTLSFINKIINQLVEFTKDIETDIKNSEIDTPKKESHLKKNRFSLKKEKDEEHTQDEFLEIYKIDMTEDIGVPFNKETTENGKVSDDNSSVSTNNLLEDEADINEYFGEKEILNNIGPDSAESDSGESAKSFYSCSTLIIDPTQPSVKSIGGENEIEAEDDKVSKNDDNATKNDDKEVKETDGKIEDEDEERNPGMKQCSVILSDCEREEKDDDEGKDDEQEKDDQEEKGENGSREDLQYSDKEMRAIDNLVNLNNLERKRKLDEVEDLKSKKSKKSKKCKRSKRDSDSSGSSSDNSTSDSDIDYQNLSGNEDETVKPAEAKNGTLSNSGIELMNLLLECVSDVSDLIEDGSNNDETESSSEEDVNKNKKKILEEKVPSEEKTEVSEDAQMSEDLIETSSVNEAKRKKKKWRMDKLLTAKLTDGSSDDEKENDPEQRRRSKRLKRNRKKREGGNSKSIELTTNSERDHSSDSDFETFSIENLSFSSDSSSSDVEFINVISDDETGNESGDPAKGRKNIRMVKSDFLLTESTKKAQKEEEERRERLLSQTQLLSQISEDERLILDIDKVTKESSIVVDTNLARYLKPHQKEGVRFMWTNCYESVAASKNGPGSGCILAHCMGLGKSFQVIALIHTLFSYELTNTKRVLIVCPLSTVLNWNNEFKICADMVEKKTRINRFLITDGKSKSERYRVVINWHRDQGVLILSYDSFQSLLRTSEGDKVTSVPKRIVEALLDPGPDLVICDEGHLIKNGTRNRSKALAKIKTKRRIILTGTPMQNNLTEYYYMVDFVKPNLLGTRKEFNNRFNNPIVNGGYDNSTEADIKLMRKRSHVLHEYLKDTIQRVETSELELYLPDKLDYVLFIRLSPLQVELYKAYLEFIGSGEMEKRKYFLMDYLRFRDIWTHPCILQLKEQNKKNQNKRKEVDTIPVEPEIQEDIPNDWWRSISPQDLLTNIEYGPKMKVMLEIIEHSIRLNDKVLIFGSHLSELDAIEYFLQENGWRKNFSYLRMDGTVAPEMRMSFCNRFNSPLHENLKLFVLSHQVGGLGLNLVAANRIILMDVNFNPSHDSQSVFRTYRFGQHKRCHVYRLVSMGTMEEVIYERSITKLAVSLRVVDEHQITRHYKSNDLQKMYRFNIYTDEERPVPKLPDDGVLAAILERCEKEIFKYHEHQDLLENRPEEQLNEEEQKLAWDEFRKEQEATYENQMVINNARIQNIQNPPSTTVCESTPLQQPSTTASGPLSPEIIFVNGMSKRSPNTLQKFQVLLNKPLDLTVPRCKFSSNPRTPNIIPGRRNPLLSTDPLGPRPPPPSKFSPDPRTPQVISGTRKSISATVVVDPRPPPPPPSKFPFNPRIPQVVSGGSNSILPTNPLAPKPPPPPSNRPIKLSRPQVVSGGSNSILPTNPLAPKPPPPPSNRPIKLSRPQVVSGGSNSILPTNPLAPKPPPPPSNRPIKLSRPQLVSGGSNSILPTNPLAPKPPPPPSKRPIKLSTPQVVSGGSNSLGLRLPPPPSKFPFNLKTPQVVSGGNNSILPVDTRLPPPSKSLLKPETPQGVSGRNIPLLHNLLTTRTNVTGLRVKVKPPISVIRGANMPNCVGTPPLNREQVVPVRDFPVTKTPAPKELKRSFLLGRNSQNAVSVRSRLPTSGVVIDLDKCPEDGEVVNRPATGNHSSGARNGQINQPRTGNVAPGRNSSLQRKGSHSSGARNGQINQPRTGNVAPVVVASGRNSSSQRKDDGNTVIELD